MESAVKITVLENFMPVGFQEYLYDNLTTPYFPLFLNKTTANETFTYKDGSFKDKNTIETPQLTHILYAKGQVVSEYWRYAEPIVYQMKHVFGGNIDLLRCKLNANTPSSRLAPHNYHTPHIDYAQDEILTAIYYLNDSDGDTIFFDTPTELVDKLTVMQRVTPKRGTLVYFKSPIVHAGTPPVNTDFRYVLNFNFVVTK